MRKIVLPFYIVMDVSGSMRDEDPASKKKRIELAAEIIPSLLESTQRSASAQAQLRVSVIGFNKEAFYLSMADKKMSEKSIDKLRAWWKITGTDGLLARCEENLCTNYTKLFSFLEKEIKKDYEELKESYELYRPLVYFLTDGKPYGNDETPENIKAAFDMLVTDNAGNEKPNELKSPDIFCIGMGDDVNREDLVPYAAGRVQWDSAVKHYVDGDFIKGNKEMVCVFKNEIETKLKNLNKEVVISIVNSLNGPADPKNGNEVSFTGGRFDDESIYPALEKESSI